MVINKRSTFYKLSSDAYLSYTDLKYGEVCFVLRTFSNSKPISQRISFIIASLIISTVVKWIRIL